MAAFSFSFLVLGGCGTPPPVPDAEEASEVAEAASDPNAPGVRQTGPNRYTAVIYSVEGFFDPSRITVPVGSEVTFRLRSGDVDHGLVIEGTDLELSSSTDASAEATYTFTEAGEYPFACHIYCGGGHESMSGKVVVE